MKCLQVRSVNDLPNKMENTAAVIKIYIFFLFLDKLTFFQIAHGKSCNIREKLHSFVILCVWTFIIALFHLKLSQNMIFESFYSNANGNRCPSDLQCAV